MATWGLRRTTIRDRNGWFYMLWQGGYKAGRGYRPLAGDTLKVWDGDGRVNEGQILEVRSFLYASHPEVKMALGGVREADVPYLEASPASGWCVAVRAELKQGGAEECPIEGEASWRQLS